MNRLAQGCLYAGLAFAAASLSGCEEDEQATCEDLEGKVFESIEEPECLETEICQRQVGFGSGGTAEWGYTNETETETGTYSCEGRDISAVFGGDILVSGRYDGDSGILTLSELDYSLLGKSCETDQDCGEGELCDLFLPLPICASLACTSDDQECPTNYSCSNEFGDDCDPRSGDTGCPSYCECADGCSPDTCQADVDCDFGEFCVRVYSADCWSFSCKTDADCVGDPDQAEVCEEHESCPPEGSVCVDNPRDDCDFGTDPDCTGICALP
jgi:hypothetical protein